MVSQSTIASPLLLHRAQVPSKHKRLFRPPRCPLRRHCPGGFLSSQPTPPYVPGHERHSPANFPFGPQEHARALLFPASAEPACTVAMSSPVNSSSIHLYRSTPYTPSTSPNLPLWLPFPLAPPPPHVASPLWFLPAVVDCPGTLPSPPSYSCAR